MITMLYEKTLSRQIIGESALSDTSKPPDEEIDSAVRDSNTVKEPQGTARVVYKTFRKFGQSLRRCIWPGSSHQAQKQPASIGKIFNLMR